LTKDEALKLALEALQLVSIEFVCNGAHHAKKDRHDWLESCPIVERYQAAITVIKEALAQPAQEPLTDKQILADETLRYYFGQNGGAGPVSKQGRRVVDAIEAIHGIKETEK